MTIKAHWFSPTSISVKDTLIGNKQRITSLFFLFAICCLLLSLLLYPVKDALRQGGISYFALFSLPSGGFNYAAPFMNAFFCFNLLYFIYFGLHHSIDSVHKFHHKEVPWHSKLNALLLAATSFLIALGFILILIPISANKDLHDLGALIVYFLFVIQLGLFALYKPIICPLFVIDGFLFVAFLMNLAFIIANGCIIQIVYIIVFYSGLSFLIYSRK